MEQQQQQQQQSQNQAELETFKFKNYGSCQVIGASFSGKSQLLLKIIKFRNRLFWPRQPDVVLWCHSGLEQPELFAKLRRECKNIKFLVGLDELKKIKWDRRLFHILVLDDIYLECMNDSYVNELFFRTAHHCSIFIFLLQQNTYAKGKFALDVSRNAKYIILFNNKRDRRTIENIAKNTAGLKPADIHEIFRMITEHDQFGYVVFDMHQLTKPEFQIVSRITPDQYPSVYFHVDN